MNDSARGMPRRSGLRALILLALITSACATVTLVAQYDQEIDSTATSLQKQMDSYLSTLQAATDTSVRSYQHNKQFYVDYGVSLRSLALRAASSPKNDITSRQVTALTASLGELRDQHQKALLSSGYIDGMRKEFNQSWGAIIAFELAKKRGEKPTSPKS